MLKCEQLARGAITSHKEASVANNSEKTSRGGVGVWTLIVKLSGKFSRAIFPLLGKLIKGLKVGKVVLAAASMASYAYVFTWKFSLMLMVMLFIHESGHIWAMKRYGMKTKGIYFIPFFGGAAVAEGEFPSRHAEVVIAIMGPIWGFACAIATGCLYVLTKNPTFAAASSWMAMVNLFNLLPINPLDGGRIFKSIAFSIHSKIGLVFLAVGIVASVFLAYHIKIGLFGLLLVIGTFDLIHEFKKSPKWMERSMEKLHNKFASAEAGYQAWQVEYAALAKRVDSGNVSGFDIVIFRQDKRYKDYNSLQWKIRGKERELEALRNAPLMPSLDGRGIATSAVSYFVVAGVLWGLMFYMSHIPGAALALKVLEG